MRQVSALVSIRTSVTTAPAAKLSVKELAAELGRGVHYVYQMRACGFKMEWNWDSRCYEATAAGARAWIVRTGFSLLNGVGRVER